MKKLVIVLKIILLALIFVPCIVSTIKLISNFEMLQKSNSEVFLFDSKSPDEKYTLQVYKTESLVIGTSSIKVYLIIGEVNKLIYNEKNESKAQIIWIDNNIVSINGKNLDLSAGEKYDWRLQ